MKGHSIWNRIRSCVHIMVSTQTIPKLLELVNCLQSNQKHNWAELTPARMWNQNN
jgi:hypothetical protein